MERLAYGFGVRVCPLCETAELRLHGIVARCDSCNRIVEGAVLRTIEQIAGLPAALGRHACECGHPEMRRLPDGVFHCPACRAEVTPARTNPGAEGSNGGSNGRGEAARLSERAEPSRR